VLIGRLLRWTGNKKRCGRSLLWACLLLFSACRYRLCGSDAFYLVYAWPRPESVDAGISEQRLPRGLICAPDLLYKQRQTDADEPHCPSAAKRYTLLLCLFSGLLSVTICGYFLMRASLCACAFWIRLVRVSTPVEPMTKKKRATTMRCLDDDPDSRPCNKRVLCSLPGALAGSSLLSVATSPNVLYCATAE
jgi:hypothetical protein